MPDKPIIAPCPLKIIWCTPTGVSTRALRRFVYHGQRKCLAKGDWGCDATSLPIGEFPTVRNERGYVNEISPDLYKDDSRWPKICDTCGQPFEDKDERQVFTDEFYQGTNGERKPFREWMCTPGAMWNAWWMTEFTKGPDGMCLNAVCPDGHTWEIDGRCSNCTLPKDNVHKCWPRSGTPPNIDVNKRHGPTCSAGAGSIQTPNWHGFLRNGFFTLN